MLQLFQLNSLHWAAFYGSTECLSLLLSCGVNCLQLDDRKRLAIHYACLSQEDTCSQCISLLLEASPNSINKKDSLGLTPLHLASQSHVDKVETLLSFKKNSVDIDAVDNMGQTALHVACAR